MVVWHFMVLLDCLSTPGITVRMGESSIQQRYKTPIKSDYCLPTPEVYIWDERNVPKLVGDCPMYFV
jgi:hypothetical protein